MVAGAGFLVQLVGQGHEALQRGHRPVGRIGVGVAEHGAADGLNGRRILTERLQHAARPLRPPHRVHINQAAARAPHRTARMPQIVQQTGLGSQARINPPADRQVEGIFGHGDSMTEPGRRQVPAADRVAEDRLKADGHHTPLPLAQPLRRHRTRQTPSGGAAGVRPRLLRS